MGVQSLTKLVNKRNIYQEEFFRGKRLVIDGSNLVYHLYFDSGLDQIHGGEYGAFMDLVTQFISALRTCDITPYVVFDGCSDLSDKKLETERERALQRIQKAHNAAHKNDQSLGVLPALIWDVFRQTLETLGVNLCRSYTEADRQVAALAHEWGCPVLSNDSDFFIFPSKGGMLPTAHFRWQEVERRSLKFIPCKKYFYTEFCSFFGIKPQFLPVFAVLAGNDYVKTPVGTNYTKQGQPRTTQYVCPKLEQILEWIRNQEMKNIQEVFIETLKGLSEENKKKQLNDLLQGALHYSLPPSTLSEFFTQRNPPPLPPEMVNVVPDWMMLPVTEARFSSDFLDVLTVQRNSLAVVVDHKDKPSANLVSRPLREVLYALLLGENSSVTVEERDREELQLRLTKVQPATGVPLNIHTLHKEKTSLAEEPQCLQVLLTALGVSKDCLSSLPPHLSHLQLPLAATCYWLKKTSPPPHLLEALLIAWCQGDDLRHEAVKNPVLKQPLDLDWCHSLNQWQSCLKDSCLLNTLLDGPLPDPPIARLYNGSLVHVLLHKMKHNQLDIRSGDDSRTLLTIITENTQRNPGDGTGLTLDQTPSSSVLSSASRKRMRKQ